MSFGEIKVGDLVQTVKPWGWHGKPGIVMRRLSKESRFVRYEIMWPDGLIEIIWDYNLEKISESR